MKKLALILAMVCFVLALGAQEWKPEVSVTGSATATLGFNLDTNVFALSNSQSAGIKMTLLPKASAEKGGEGTYGYIKLIDFRVIIDDSNAWTLDKAKITAKIVSGPIFVQIADESNATKAISVGRFGFPNITDGKILNLTAQSFPAEVTGSYLYAGYDSDLFDLTVKVANGNNTCTDPKDAKANWFFAPTAAVTVAGATVKAGVEFGTLEKGTTGYVAPGIGASVSYSMDLAKVGETQVTLAPSAGFDMVLADTDADKRMAIGAGVFAKWGGNDEYDAYYNLTQVVNNGATPAVACTAANTYKTGDDVKYQGGAGVAVQYYKIGTADAQINMIAQVNEQRGDAGLVPKLGAAVGLTVEDVTSADAALKSPKISLGAFANYAIDNLTPYIRAVYTTENKTAADATVKATMLLGVGAELANVFPNTKLFADYNVWNALADTNNKGLVSGGVKISF